jgi:protein TonB
MLAPRSARWRRLRTRAPSLVGVIALHVAGLVALLHYEPVREALASAAPIMVSLITPRLEVEPPKPKAEPPKPKPRPARPPIEEPLISAPVETPSPTVAPAPPPPPQPVEAAAGAPVVAPVVAPLPIIPPNFNADYLHNPAPVYPLVARRNGEQGRVVLHVLVTADGQPAQVAVRTSSGSARLDGAALETVQRWRFMPARQGGRPVAAWVLVPISFVLEG